MLFQASVTVTRRPTILDPEGKAIEHALHELGLNSLSQVRVGKRIDTRVEAADEAEARAALVESCRKLLANPVMDDFVIELTPVEA